MDVLIVRPFTPYHFNRKMEEFILRVRYTPNEEETIAIIEYGESNLAIPMPNWTVNELKKAPGNENSLT